MTTIHPFLPEDELLIAATRAATAAHKGEPLGTEARPMFDAMLSATPAAEGVRVEPGTVGGISGVWCRPANSTKGVRLLYLHGGGYILGSSAAFANFVGQIATRAGADTFVPDYRRAPEHPFPAAIEDAAAAYKGLTTDGAGKVAIAGDSAGGGLTLSLLSLLAAERSLGTLQPIAAAVMSPWTDLTLSAPSMETRSAADPIFTGSVLRALAELYLQGGDALDPRASPLFAPLYGLPPLRIDVGDDEILRDDAVRYADRARLAGVNVSLNIWVGMPHVFQSSLARLRTAETALGETGRFLHDAFTEERRGE